MRVNSARVFGAGRITAGVKKRDGPDDRSRWTNAERWSWRPHAPEILANFGHWARSLKRSFDVAAETNYRPGRARRKVVLYFTGGGITAPCDVRALRESGIKYFLVDLDQWISRGTVEIRIEGECTAVFTLGEARLDLRDVAAVVWNIPSWMVLNEIEPIAAGQGLNRCLMIRRWSQVLRDLRGLVPPETIWLPSHPMNGSQDFQNRTAEYQLARRAGLNVPPVICTNDPKAAAAFISRHGGLVYWREFSMPPYNYIPRLVTTAEVRAQAKSVRRAPCTFMKPIDKEYDVRAVVVGDRVFAVRINSQDSPLKTARLDWRAYDNAHVRWERMTLPNELERSMLGLMKILDLRWGSFDLIKGRDGRFYFLEVNRPGASFWLQPFVGLDVSREIVSYLKRVL